jgi:DNA (cytosine-5)-methyltransferase 1
MKSGPKDDDPLMLELIRSAFAEIGYGLSHQVLEAKEFGVPQSRKRLLLVGWKLDRYPTFDPVSFWPSVMAWGSSQALPRLSSFVQNTLEGAFQLDPRAIPPNFDTVALSTEDRIVTGSPHPYVVLKAVSFDTEYNGKQFDRLLSCGKRDSPIHSEVLNLEQPCKTIICTYDHQPRLLVGLKNSSSGTCYIRALLPYELKQIQGFPADFQLCGTVKEQIVQIGNAVPPALVQAVACQLVKLLPALVLPPFSDTAPPTIPSAACALPKKKLLVVKRLKRSVTKEAPSE